MADIVIPADLKPADGRFGCGPSKVRPEQLAALAAAGAAYLGTSHRQKPVQALVGRVRDGPGRAVRPARRLRGRARQRRHHRVLGHRRLRPGPERRQHLTFGEFSSKFAEVAAERAVAGRAHRDQVADPGTHPSRRPRRASTSTRSPTTRPPPAWPCRSTRAGGDRRPLVLVDATSGAGGLPVDVGETDVYYFAPQKCFASDGGLWIAAGVAARRSPASTRSPRRGR